MPRRSAKRRPAASWRGASLTAVVCVIAHMMLASLPAAADEPATKVFLNGVPAPVYFNDGDSFRVLSGEFAGSKGRLAGFNTLESYGPVHQWGDWTYHELYVLAKMGTLNGRNGIWHCESDLSTDTYGRTLWWCEDLAVDQVRKGLAHVLSVDEKPGHPAVVEAQREAIKNKRGIWAHGVPELVLTSTHSASEGGGRDGKTYNRLVSSADGHSEKWLHTDSYDECEDVCHLVADPAKANIDDVVARLKGEPTLSSFISAYDDQALRDIATRFYALGVTGFLADKDHLAPMKEALQGYLDGGIYGPYEPTTASCMRYVDFRRRFGGGKAECLK